MELTDSYPVQQIVHSDLDDHDHLPLESVLCFSQEYDVVILQHEH